MKSIGRHRAPSPPLELTLAEVDDSALRLTARGHLTAATVDDLSEALEILLAQPGLTRLLMDFGPLASVDSAGITALVTAHQNAERRGIALALVDCGNTVRRNLEVTSLYGRLTQGQAVGQRGQAMTVRPHPLLPGPRQIDHRGRDREDATALNAVTASGLRP